MKAQPRDEWTVLEIMEAIGCPVEKLGAWEECAEFIRACAEYPQVGYGTRSSAGWALSWLGAAALAQQLLQYDPATSRWYLLTEHFDFITGELGSKGIGYVAYDDVTEVQVASPGRKRHLPRARHRGRLAPPNWGNVSRAIASTWTIPF